ncbi:crossover junction endodeoxyribonuclease RuvC [Kallipyga gabonensis]|uniref:crossover junction endodeoxyribonuclease RuvC n=1 Tax=Kallipyga gabonensis TaxID=1686287 RepID=UPI0006B55207|nr:crossover junction endodeoxyribonuclease RuvC [Kallipyga gabonensis]
MILLGIDPGLALVGYGVIQLKEGRVTPLEYGCIETLAGMSLPERLAIIDQEMEKLIDDYQPDQIAFEELFFYRNKTTIISVAQARGVEILAGVKRGLPIYEFTPSQIKQAVTGYGRANKLQIQRSIQALLGLTELPKPDDAADGLAVAMTLAFSQRFREEYRME